MPGMYPTVAGKILKSMPPTTVREKGGFQSYDDMMKLVALTGPEKEVVGKYKDKFVFAEPRPEYVIDNLNNGLYR